MTVRVFHRPIDGFSYAIGGDPAMGQTHSDDSCLQVFCAQTGQQCAELQGKYDGTELGEEAYVLGKYYNTALVGIENNMDVTALKVLNDLGYERLHMDRRFVKPYEEQTARMGVNTNLLSKNLFINNALAYLKDRSVTIHSPYLQGQMETFAWEGAKAKGIKNAPDDLVMAFLIAVEMLRVLWQEEKVGDEGIWIDGELYDPDEPEKVSDTQRRINQCLAGHQDPDQADFLKLVI